MPKPLERCINNLKTNVSKSGVVVVVSLCGILILPSANPATATTHRIYKHPTTFADNFEFQLLFCLQSGSQHYYLHRLPSAVALPSPRCHRFTAPTISNNTCIRSTCWKRLCWWRLPVKPTDIVASTPSPWCITMVQTNLIFLLLCILFHLQLFYRPHCGHTNGPDVTGNKSPSIARVEQVYQLN